MHSNHGCMYLYNFSRYNFKIQFQDTCDNRVIVCSIVIKAFLKLDYYVELLFGEQVV